MKYIAVALLLALVGCSERTVPGGEVTLRNDIRDSSYNIIQVSIRGTRSFRTTLKPGDEVVVPVKGIRSMSFSRRYQDHTKLYEVECPKGFDKAIEVKLINVHMNRIGGGCVLVKRGKQFGPGRIEWEVNKRK